MKILNQTKKTVLATRCQKADSAFLRMKGLLGRTSLENEEALLITHCNSIHMFFMKFPLDIIFANQKDKVVGLIRGIKPWQMSPLFWKAAYVVEMSPGLIDETQTELGDQLSIQE